jgi:hypothetical protein
MLYAVKDKLTDDELEFLYKYSLQAHPNLVPAIITLFLRNNNTELCLNLINNRLTHSSENRDNIALYFCVLKNIHTPSSIKDNESDLGKVFTEIYKKSAPVIINWIGIANTGNKLLLLEFPELLNIIEIGGNLEHFYDMAVQDIAEENCEDKIISVYLSLFERIRQQDIDVSPKTTDVLRRRLSSIRDINLKSKLESFIENYHKREKEIIVVGEDVLDPKIEVRLRERALLSMIKQNHGFPFYDGDEKTKSIMMKLLLDKTQPLSLRLIVVNTITAEIDHRIRNKTSRIDIEEFYVNALQTLNNEPDVIIPLILGVPTDLLSDAQQLKIKKLMRNVLFDQKQPNHVKSSIIFHMAQFRHPDKSIILSESRRILKNLSLEKEATETYTTSKDMILGALNLVFNIEFESENVSIDEILVKLNKMKPEMPDDPPEEVIDKKAD